MALVILDKEKLLNLLIEVSSCWHFIGGGANMDAYEFDPKHVDLAKLKSDGYFVNSESWIAGICVKKIESYIDEYLDTAVSGE